MMASETPWFAYTDPKKREMERNCMPGNFSAMARRINSDADEINRLTTLLAALPPAEGTPEWQAMVERAIDAYFEGDGYEWREQHGVDHLRASMAAALRAAITSPGGPKLR